MTRRHVRHWTDRGLVVAFCSTCILAGWAIVLIWPVGRVQFLIQLAVTIVVGGDIVCDVTGRFREWRERRRLVRERWARVLRILEDSRAEVLAEADALADKFRRSVS